MLDFFKENKFLDINKLFSIVDITDNYILQNINGITMQTYIYEVKPITVINMTDELEENIISNYTEFLKSIAISFEIYMQNELIDISDYFSKLFEESENISKNELKKMYLEEIDRSLKLNNTIITKYYLVFALKSDAELQNVQDSLKSLSNITLVSKVTGASTLRDFVYTKINRINIPC